VKIELHPEAEMELFEAAAWYDDQVPGLGNDILVELGQWLDIIAESPLAWPKWPDAPTFDPPIRRALPDRFPYAIAYRAYADRIWVLAFAHTSRRPFYWAGRLES